LEVHLTNGNLEEGTGSNRGLLYGDGFFDTLLWHGGKAVWGNAHWERMQQSARTLALSLPFASESEWQAQLNRLWQVRGKPQTAKVRTVLWRHHPDPEGRCSFLPEANTAEWMINLEVLPLNPWTAPALSLVLGNSPVVKCPPLIPDLKSLSALPYVLAAQYASLRGWNDALLQNPGGEWIESSRSNLFYLKGESWYSPPVESGCLPGVTAQQLIAWLHRRGHRVLLQSPNTQDLADARAIWLTNSLQGIQSVTLWHRPDTDAPPMTFPEAEWHDLARTASQELLQTA